MTNFTHFDEAGRARMVDVSGKSESLREAVAAGEVRMQPETLAAITNRAVAKGDVLAIAQVAGIMAAKRTPDIVPLCHPIFLSGVEVRLEPEEERSCVRIVATVRTTASTGVEMEALTAVMGAGLCVYDMCKALDRGMSIERVRLLRKTGGTSGDVELEDVPEPATPPARPERARPPVERAWREPTPIEAVPAPRGPDRRPERPEPGEPRPWAPRPKPAGPPAWEERPGRSEPRPWQPRPERGERPREQQPAPPRRQPFGPPTTHTPVRPPRQYPLGRPTSPSGGRGPSSGPRDQSRGPGGRADERGRDQGQSGGGWRGGPSGGQPGGGAWRGGPPSGGRGQGQSGGGGWHGRPSSGGPGPGGGGPNRGPGRGAPSGGRPGGSHPGGGRPPGRGGPPGGRRQK